jgi:hypothetical protein
MKYPTVSALCEGVAGAIREKEGSTALINPQDFVDRIKGLEVGGGIPDVPTLECWKITTEDQDVKMLLVEEIYAHDNRPLIFGTIGEDVYAGLYPIFGTGYPPEGVQSFYLLFFNTWAHEPNELLDLLSANGGEKIPLSTYLDVASTIIPW